MSVTYPITDIDKRKSHDEISLQYAGEVNYKAIVKSGYHYAADIKIIADGRDEVDILTVLFSKWPL